MVFSDVDDAASSSMILYRSTFAPCQYLVGDEETKRIRTEVLTAVAMAPLTSTKAYTQPSASQLARSLRSKARLRSPLAVPSPGSIAKSSSRPAEGSVSPT